MTPVELLSYLHSLNIKLWAGNGRLFCNDPKGALTADLQAAVTEHKAEILALLHKRPGSEPLSLQRMSREDQLPLSFAQQRLWFIGQLERDSALYNVPRAFRITGSPDITALERGFNEIVRRHEVLRTAFPAVEGQPFQLILPSLNLSLAVLDLPDLPVSERENATLRLVNEEAQRPFDLARGPLVRATLVRLAPEDHILLLTLHHIVSDGWSMEILLRELSVLYDAFSTGRPSPLRELPIQYADFALWQRKSLQGEVLDSQVRYWKKQLAGAPLVLELPTDRVRPTTQTFHGTRQRVRLPKELTEAVKKLSRRERVTLFMTLLAAFQTLLHRHTGQADILVGFPVANRTRVEVEQLIGFFVNTLVLRAEFSCNQTFRQLLGGVREACFEAYAHQDLPFEKLVEELQPDRDLSRNPLFQVMFQFRNLPNEVLRLPGLTVEECASENVGAKFDLTLDIEESAGELLCMFVYNSDLFDEDRIKRMAGHFQTLLEAIVADPEQSLSDLPLLTDMERHRLLVQWNDTSRDYPRDKCIHELFEVQVERSPEAIALVFEDQQLTYRELNRRANQLAHYLRKLGVGPETLVGICVERSLEMVVGLLAILKAGGAYVPLDPDHPKERVAVLLEEAQAPVVLTQEKLLTQVDHPTVVCLDRDWKDIAAESDVTLENDATASNMAYVIYTSGSTGQPKGVAVENRPLVNYSLDIVQCLNPTIGNHFAMVQPLTVDSCITMIFPCLITGGTLHVIAREKAISPVELSDYFRCWPMDFLKIAPSHLAALQASSSPELFMPRRSLIIGGEGSRWDWLRSLQALAPDCTIYNHYGPTETTVGVLMNRLHDSELSRQCVNVPLGRPIANTQAYILDAALKPVPVGIPGELYIGGDNLARGYLNRPELTSEQFIASPFSRKPGVRLYRTGDLARYLPDRSIDFLGRTDQQVKIRGFRIEPAEIEATMIQHPEVDQAIVVPWVDQAEAQRLAAYVVAKKRRLLNATELRGFLKQKLPEYLVPSAFVFLDSLPRTPHGKVDRKALPPPDGSRPELERAFVAPRTPVEEALAGIWAEVLKLEKVGIHDNLFDLGGHSLLATQVTSRIRDTFRLELPLRSLFEAPTVAGLAEQISSAREGKAWIRALPILPEPIDQEYPLSFSQERFWFLSQLEPNNLAYKITLGFHLTGPLNIKALEQSLREIVRRHETLRTRFHLRNSEPVQVISERWSFPLTIIDLRQQTPVDSEAEVQRLFENERRSPFDLSADVLLRATLLQLGADEHVLVLSSHHVAWDHWCIELFLRELSLLYHAFVTAKPSPLSELPIQYKHYALWQRKMFQGAELENYLAYWNEQLVDAPPSLNLPADHPRKPLQNRQGGRQTLVLPKGLDSALRSLSRKADVTFFMTLLAAFQTLLHRMTGDDDIVVGTPVAGRDRSETEGLIGLFLNSLALRTNLSGNPTFLELLSRVREVALGAYDHQELPFEKLVAELQPERDLSRTPIFQVFINMYNFKEVSLELDRLSVRPLKTPEPTPQFDLEFYIREHHDGLHLIFVYDSDLFESDTIARLLAHFQVLLEGIISHPGQRLSDLPLLTEAEKHQLLVEWNDTKREYPRDKCIQELFEEQVKKLPDAIAVVREDEQLTYRELNRRANQLAHYLIKQGVGPETLVGICAERSLEMIIGLLGILKAGGAYLPLDPEYPKDRLAFMLEDARPAVLLTQKHLLERLSEQGVQTVCLDSDWETNTRESGDTLVTGPTADNLAYVIYTSGSTGKPKGVAIKHRSTVALVCWAREILSPEDISGALASTSICFDLSIFEIFFPLSWGGTVILAKNALDLPTLQTAKQVTLVNTVPSAIAELVRVDGLPASVQTVCLAGELLTTRLVQQLYQQQTIRKVFDLYGPSEDTTYSTFALRNVGGPVTIGRPIAGTQIYVLDSRLQPVPIGVSGELYIGGAGLARGYLNRPELTAERFIPNPFSDKPGARLYKTGDLARYLADGNIEFLGRIDNQVKVRGFRIELGEIETALSQHPAVRETVVVAREDPENTEDTLPIADGEGENPKSEIQNPKSAGPSTSLRTGPSASLKTLVAYIVSNPDPSPSTSDLRSFLKEQLPDYMIPSAFVFLDSWPLTPNGKVDRRALPAPGQTRPELDGTFVAPRSSVEEALVRIWAQVLGLDKVGIQHNFFDLGGHSLKATQIISRVRETFQVNLPLRTLFEKPTIEDLGRVISEKQTEKGETRELTGILRKIESLSNEEAPDFVAKKS